MLTLKGVTKCFQYFFVLFFFDSYRQDTLIHVKKRVKRSCKSLVMAKTICFCLIFMFLLLISYSWQYKDQLKVGNLNWQLIWNSCKSMFVLVFFILYRYFERLLWESNQFWFRQVISNARVFSDRSGTVIASVNYCWTLLIVNFRFSGLVLATRLVLSKCLLGFYRFILSLFILCINLLVFVCF